MALASSAWTDVRSDRMQVRMEADVRRLLRRANNPFLLGSLPLAQALCEATGIANPASALRAAIDDAFQQGLQEAGLRQMLLSTIASGANSAINTGRFELSKRHLQRRRAKAVAILALHVRRLIGVPQLTLVEDEAGVTVDPLETLAELTAGIEPALASQLLKMNGHRTADAGMLAMRECVDAGTTMEGAVREFGGEVPPALVAVLRAQALEVSGAHDGANEELWPLFGRLGRDSVDTPEMRFELEWLAFLRAQHRGDARQMERVARSLKRLARNRASWLSRALLADAQAKMCCGLVPEAIEVLDEVERRGLRNVAVIDLACGSALRAELFLQQGDDASAERLATGSYVVLRGRHAAAWRCRATLARARLRMGRPWNDEDDRWRPAECTWDGLSLAVERARHSLAAGDASGAIAVAREALDIATRRRYDGVAARAAATIAACEPATKDRRDWSLHALSSLVMVRDRSAGCDLFPFEPERSDVAVLFDSSADLVDLVYQALTTAIPQLRAQSDREARVAQAFLQDLYDYVVGSPCACDFDERIAGLNASAPAFAQYLRYFADEAFDIVETLFTAIVPMQRRADVERRLKLAERAIAMLIQPRDNLRHFLVG